MDVKTTYGHTYVYEDGTIADKNLHEKKLVFYCAVSKNIGLRLSRYGPETEMCIYIDEEFYNKDKRRLSGLIERIEKENINEDVKKGMKNLFRKEKLKSGIHRI